MGRWRSSTQVPRQAHGSRSQPRRWISSCQDGLPSISTEMFLSLLQPCRRTIKSAQPLEKTVRRQAVRYMLIGLSKEARR